MLCFRRGGIRTRGRANERRLPWFGRFKKSSLVSPQLATGNTTLSLSGTLPVSAAQTGILPSEVRSSRSLLQ